MREVPEKPTSIQLHELILNDVKMKVGIFKGIITILNSLEFSQEEADREIDVSNIIRSLQEVEAAYREWL